jgi:hypothetical protein
MADHGNKRPPAAGPAAVTATRRSGMSKSMHDGVEVWCDCCSCEAEPYWVEAFAEADAPDPGAATDQSRE